MAPVLRTDRHHQPCGDSTCCTEATAAILTAACTDLLCSEQLRWQSVHAPAFARCLCTHICMVPVDPCTPVTRQPVSSSDLMWACDYVACNGGVRGPSGLSSGTLALQPQCHAWSACLHLHSSQPPTTQPSGQMARHRRESRHDSAITVIACSSCARTDAGAVLPTVAYHRDIGSRVMSSA